MKTLSSLIAVSVVSAFVIATSALADMKGGERLITLNAAKAPLKSVAPSGKKMACPVETRLSTDQSARGAFKHVSAYTAHLCASCDTKAVTKGVGKLARHGLEHSCKKITVCCNGE